MPDTHSNTVSESGVIALTVYEESRLENFLLRLSTQIFTSSAEHGFHGTPEKDNVPTKLMLIVSEIVEAMEADRKDRQAPSTAVPAFTNFEEELADAVIRILDLSSQLGLNVPGAIITKVKYNSTRPFMHGGKLY